MKNPPMKHIADQLATHGRYGDTMLVHMNPREVEGIASLVPGGKLTINPVTGQPEAFLPFLVPILGSMLGSAAAGAGMLGGLGTLAGSAIGSGLATTLATGDLEQGLISGITGFGLGSALSGLGGAAGAGGAGTAPGALDIPGAQELVNTALSETPTGIPQGITAPSVGAGTAQNLTGMLPQPTDMQVAGVAGTGAPNAQIANFQQGATPSIANPETAKGIMSLNAPQNVVNAKPTFTEGLQAPFKNPTQFLKNMTKPESFLPFYVGEGTNASIRAQKEMEESGLNFKREQEKEGSMAREGILRALERVRTDYGMFAGGQVDYAEGGDIKSIISSVKNKGVDPADAATAAYVENFYGGYGGPAGLQSSLRGPVLNTPPAFDYDALFSGGSGYAPGIAPEFMFFGQRAPDAGGGTGGGTPPGGGGTGGGGALAPSLPGGGFNFPQSDFGYINVPATDTYDIQSILDRLGPTENDYLREEMARQPTRMFAEGGPVDPAVEATVNPFQGEYDNLVQSTISAIKGEIENPEAIINKFVEEYGPEAFMQLREQVLQGVQPGAQTQGLVDGPGGGMDDMVQGSIADGRPVAVSPGEYIVPADVVSAAGDGNTGGGAKFFDDLIESIRVSKNGTPEQPRPMKEIMG
jgi:hypothetical protein